MKSRRWASTLFWASLAPFVVGLTLLLIRQDLAELFVGTFGAPRWKAAPYLLSLAAVGAGAALALDPRAGLRTTRAAQIVTVASATLMLLGAVVAAPPYGEETVAYSNCDVRLAGTLYLPRTPGPHATMVIVHGSAPFKRTFYHLWADRLARRGFGVLLADKRGVGASGGDFERNDNASEKNLALLASDVSAGVRYLLGRRDIDAGRIGLLGLSQAGWVAPQAALETSSIRYMAMITAPTVSTHEEGAWSRLRGDDEAPASASRMLAEAILDTLKPGGVDPRPLLARLMIPSLWLFGSDDNSIPSVKSVKVLQRLRELGRPVTWRTFSGFGHVLIGRPDGGFPHIAPESWPVLLDWLVQAAGHDGSP